MVKTNGVYFSKLKNNRTGDSRMSKISARANTSFNTFFVKTRN
jgi:hypothetical protein